MSYELTCSVHKGTCSNSHLGHNRRTIFVPHADITRRHLNICYKDESLQSAYHHLFDVAEYNKGKKPSRQIADYYKHIMEQYRKGEEKLQQAISSGASKKELRNIKQKYVKPYYELILTIGNMDAYDGAFACGGTNEKISVEILNRYMADFQKRNPHLYVFSAYLHMDEKTPHIHCCYIPWTDLPGRGLPVRVSENGAFIQQGLTSGRLGDYGTVKFQKQEREAIAEIAKEYDINIVAGRHSKEHQQKEQFIQNKELQKQGEFLDGQAGELLQQQDDFIAFVASSDKAIEYAEHLENIELRKSVNRQKEMLAQSWKEFNSATSTYFDNYRQNKKLLYQELQRAKQSAYTNQKELNRLLNNLIYSNDYLIIKLLKLMFALLLIFQAVSLEYEVQQLYAANERLKQCSKEVMAESKTVSAELRNKDLDRIHLAMQEYDAHLNNSIQQIKQIAYGHQIEER